MPPAAAAKPPKWRDSEAKKILVAALLSGEVTDQMKPKDVFDMHSEYKIFKYERFRSNLSSMRKAHREGSLQKAKPIKWSKSEAKLLLRDDIIVGAVTDDMDANIVYKMHEEYSPYKFANFKTNLANLRESINRNKERMKIDCMAYGQDRELLLQLRSANPPDLPPYPLWHKHPSKKLLKKDITDGKHIGVKPQQLWQSRPQYQEFPLKIFRKHIYQEIDERASKEIRFAKKKRRAPPLKETEQQAELLASANSEQKSGN